MNHPIHKIGTTFGGQYDLIAASPLFKQRSTLAYRIVLVMRGENDFVVWNEIVPDFPAVNSNSHFEHGNYCQGDLSLAIKHFGERSARLANYAAAIETPAQFEVIVGNVGTVYSGTNEDEAHRKFDAYVEQSKSEAGRAGGEDVTMMKNSEPFKEHQGSINARTFGDA